MHITDPIADMLTRIRNAVKARQKTVDIPSSGLKKALAQVLLREKLIKNLVEVPNPRQSILRIFLGYTPEKKSFISGLTRVSRPGLRTYVSKEQLSRSKQTMGLLILSTSQGLLTDQEARQKGVGGETLCKVW